jgi:NAD(P)-dependent dehydrogenase (short-subunit alcohol dehydrogenase family)
MRRFILITGASSGIGQHTAKILLEEGYEVLAGVRSMEDVERLKASFGEKIHPLIMDVTDQHSIDVSREEATKIVGEGSLVAMINNAGIVVSGAVLYVPVEAWQKQFEVNILGVIRTMQAFFPLLSKLKPEGDHHPRRIINMSSVSGLFGSPFLGPYVASKFALEGLTDSLRRELYMHDIQVVLIEPGSIITPLWQKAKDNPSYFGEEYASILEFKDRVINQNLETGLPLQAMDKVILAAVRNPKVRVRYLIRAQKWKFSLVRILPTKWVDHMVRKKLQQKSGIRPF